MKKAGIIFLIIIILLTISLKVVDLAQPVNLANDENILIAIKKGASAREIVDTLYIHNLIKSRLLFRAYIHLTDADQKLQAGYYYFTQSMDMFEILDQLKKGGNAVFKVSIPEGLSVQEVIIRLAAKSDNEVEEFEEILTGSGLDYDFLPEDNPELIYRLEGFLYPNTYTIPVGYSARETIEVVLNSFEDNVVEKIEKTEKNDKYSLYEILTVASLIEEEARFDEEKPIIASVIYNRLDQKMLLQIDATVQYALEVKKQKLFYSDLDIKSPFNTYLKKGLPPGPICNPGDKAIEAALNPEKTDYLFYFALENGEHIFTETYQEHIRKQNEIINEGSNDG
ncbi:MAG: endolytic transglycosylase MltG [Halanaerobiales bacterium]